MGDQFLQNYKQSISLADMELLNNFSGLNSIHHHHHHHNEADNLMGFWHDHNNILGQENLPAFLIQDHTTQSCDHDHKDKKRKAMVVVNTTPTSSAYSSPQVSDNGSRKTNRGKKAKGNEKQDEKERDVIHVRAKRGQATDSHSLAERVRRGKINERLRCLQDIVPGCYKTMGMAVMLDEIINYVQSLQNQVEFLSMKLTAASSFNNFNSDTDAMVDAMQRAKAFEALKIENNLIGENQQLPLNFGPHQHPSFLT